MKNTLEHISFRTNWRLSEKTANLLGQCYAYINSILNTPIRPDYYQKLLLVSLNKGALATTAIEGNTLTEADLAQIQSGRDLEPSKRYQQQEVKNILAAFNTILEELVRKKSPEIISPGLIRRFNKMVGEHIGEAFGGHPGQFRRRNVVVGAYRPPSFEKVEGLVQKLCDWLIQDFHCMRRTEGSETNTLPKQQPALQGEVVDYKQEQTFDKAVLEAIVTHVYIAWIHPFLDGNGRTARLLEFYLLMRAGIPSIASHILSNHYNDTRTRYYRELQNASETGNLSAFIEYALEGFRDGLEKIIEILHRDGTEITWNNYVNNFIEKMQDEGKTKNALRRLRQLAYYIPADRFCRIDEIKILNTKIAEAYGKLNQITLRRDLDLLVEKNLLKAEKNTYRAHYELLRDFLPEASIPIKRHY